jgi:two-component sensor histidine kinase
MFEIFPPNPNEDDAANAQDAIKAAVAEMVATGKPHVIEEQQHDLLNSEGVYETRFWSLVQWPVCRDGEVIAILQRSEDVTERVRQRRLTETVRQAAEEASGLSFFSYDPASDRFVRSAAIDAMFGFEPDEAGRLAAPFFDRVLPEDLPAVHAEVARAMAGGPGTSASFDYRVAVPGIEKLRYIRVRAGIERDPDDGLPKLFGAFVDMSDIEEARARMEELSNRNAALVVESNHRIKNSLAIASAMLSYQTQASTDDAAQAALQNAATRIMAISDVHGELFADTGVEWVDAGRLLKRFVQSFTRTIDADETVCPIEVTADSIALPSRYAVTMALMLNELLTNAVKYGMPRQEQSRVLVKLGHDGESVFLTVENEIAGKQFAEIVSEGVGTELVHAFAQQLGGAIEAGEEDGFFKVRFAFPIPPEDIELREMDPRTGA